MAEVLPLLYLHGVSVSEFGPALEQFLGTGHGLSAAAFGHREGSESWADLLRSCKRRGMRAPVSTGSPSVTLTPHDTLIHRP